MRDSERTDEKRRKTSNIPAFFLILLLLLVLSSLLFYQAAMITQDSTLLKRNAVETALLSEKKNSIDVLVVGDSESYTTVSPLQIWSESGITSFVAGQPGQTMAEMRHMLETALKKQRPKVVLVETNALYRDTRSLSGIQDLLAERFSGWFPVFQYHNLWKLVGKSKPDREASWKGYHLGKETKACGNISDYMKKTDKVKQVSWINQAILGEICSMCQDAGAQLILYSGPSPSNYSMEKHNGLKQLAEARNISYIDMNMKADRIGIDWSKDSRDGGDHLNDAGAWKTTEYLLSQLKKLNLADHRQDPAYSGWNTEAKQFLPLVTANIAAINSGKAV